MSQFQSGLETKTATIAISAAISDAIDLGGKTLCTLMTPIAWTAAGIAFQGSFDGTTYAPLYENVQGVTTEVAIASGDIATGAVRLFALDPARFCGIRYLKVVSGTNAAGVNQGAQRLVTLGVRSL